ncbi:hypothetical protein JTB14_031932 [Gonioctena quinquepunctata]|nr:hypothetical protein JTB14_031932 [Gonioctena quinquepunctata]
MCGRKEDSQMIQKRQRKQKKPKKIMVSSDIDSNIPSEIYFPDGDSSDHDRKDVIQDMQRGEESDLKFEKTVGNYNISDTLHQHTTPKINDWVVVKFATKKKKLHSVGQITDIEAGEPSVKFTRMKEIHAHTTVFCWKEPEDVIYWK